MKKWRDMTPHERLLDQCEIVKDKYISNSYLNSNKRIGTAWELGLYDPRFQCRSCTADNKMEKKYLRAQDVIVSKSEISIDQWLKEMSLIREEDQKRFIANYHIVDGKYHNGFSELQEEMVHYANIAFHGECDDNCFYCVRDKAFKEWNGVKSEELL